MHKPQHLEVVNLADEHLQAEDYPEDMMNIVESYYEDHPTAFSANKILESKNLTRLSDSQKDHLIRHMEAIISRKILERENSFKQIRNPEIGFITPSPNVARVIIRRPYRKGYRRYVFFRDLTTQRFVSAYSKLEKEKGAEKESEETKSIDTK